MVVILQLQLAVKGNIDISDINLYTQNNGQVSLITGIGEISYHQNYVEPATTFDLPETVSGRSPAQVNSNISLIYNPQNNGLDTLISFADTQEEDLE